jgi:glycosyltransferase involved in cell wall biosynthesis
VLTNGIDTELFKPGVHNGAIEQIRAKGCTTVGIYVGSLSAYHGLEHALDLLEQLRRFPHIKIVFSADGSSESEFRGAIAAKRLTNAVLLGAVPRKEMPGLIASADFGLAFVKESAFSRWLLSSKIFMYMACGRAVYAAASGETSHMIESARAGFVVPPTSDGIRKLAEQIGESRGGMLQQWGLNGRTYALRCCAWPIIASDYERVLAEAVGQLSISRAPVPSEISA